MTMLYSQLSEKVPSGTQLVAVRSSHLSSASGAFSRSKIELYIKVERDTFDGNGSSNSFWEKKITIWYEQDDDDSVSFKTIYEDSNKYNKQSSGIKKMTIKECAHKAIQESHYVKVLPEKIFCMDDYGTEL